MNITPGNAFGIDGYTSATYGDSFADVYDDWYSELDDADFVVSIVADLPSRPLRVLELGVGTGRLIHQFLSLRPTHGDTIVGVDTSQAMLDASSSRKFPSTVSLAIADFAHSLPPGPFDLIFVGYNTLFNLPDEGSVRTCLALVCEHLAPEGAFHIDVVHPIGEDSSDHTKVRHMATGEVVLSVSSHNSADQRITGHFIQFIDGGATRLRPYSVKYVSPSQLDAMANDCGLQLVRRTSNGTGTPFTPDSPRHLSKYAKLTSSASNLKAL